MSSKLTSTIRVPFRLQVVLPAVAQNGNAFGYADRLLREDPNIAFQALALNGTALAHLGEALRSDANQILLQAGSRSS